MPVSHAIVHATSAAMWLQTTDFNSAENTHLLMIFIGILAVSVAVIALAVLIGAIVVARTIKRLMQITEELKMKSMPLIGSTQGIVASIQGVVADLQPKIKRVSDDLTPKIKTVTDDLQPKIRMVSTQVADIAAILHKNVAKVDETLAEANVMAKDLNAKAKAQVDRVDGMVSSALNATSHVAQNIHHSIRVPVNQVAGVVSGLKAGLDSLLGAAGTGREQGRGATSGYLGRTGSGRGMGMSLEARREDEMDEITAKYMGTNRGTSAVTTAVGDDILPGTSVETSGVAPINEGRSMATDVAAGQRRAAEMRSAPDASDLAEPGVKPVLPKRFQ